MKRPSKLQTLIEELTAERLHSDVDIHKGSHAVIYPTEDAAVEEDGINLTGEECRMVFADRNCAERLLEALDEPSDASLVLIEVKLSHEVTDFLERNFVTLDEG